MFIRNIRGHMKLVGSMTFLLILSIATIGAAAQPHQVFHYDPVVTQIEGVLETQTSPGPPNYESIPGGDKIEASWYLRLNRPIEIQPTANDKVENAEPERNVQVIQLAIMNDKLWKQLANGKRVSVAGSLYHRWNGHHRARVLMEVNNVSEVK